MFNNEKIMRIAQIEEKWTMHFWYESNGCTMFKACRKYSKKDRHITLMHNEKGWRHALNTEYFRFYAEAVSDYLTMKNENI